MSSLIRIYAALHAMPWSFVFNVTIAAAVILTDRELTIFAFKGLLYSCIAYISINNRRHCTIQTSNNNSVKHKLKASIELNFALFHFLFRMLRAFSYQNSPEWSLRRRNKIWTTQRQIAPCDALRRIWQKLRVGIRSS